MIEVSLRAGAPLDDNKKRKISKKTVKEDHLWHKLVPNNRMKKKKVKFLSTSIASKDNNGETKKHMKRRDTHLISSELLKNRALK